FSIDPRYPVPVFQGYPGGPNGLSENRMAGAYRRTDRPAVGYARNRGWSNPVTCTVATGLDGSEAGSSHQRAVYFCKFIVRTDGPVDPRHTVQHRYGSVCSYSLHGRIVGFVFRCHAFSASYHQAAAGISTGGGII